MTFETLIMNNLDFFKAYFKNEFKATYDIIKALPGDQLEYRPHPVNRSAYEIAEHIVAHVFDFDVIINNRQCDECLSFPFKSPTELADKMKEMWEKAEESLENLDSEQWEQETVELLIHGKSFVTLPRMHMMWFFYNDIIHHRGQLSSYIRPMGGKNPAVYGYSADTV